MGVWYELEKYPLLFEAGGKCIQSTFNMSMSDGVITVVTRQTNRLYLIAIIKFTFFF